MDHNNNIEEHHDKPGEHVEIIEQTLAEIYDPEVVKSARPAIEELVYADPSTLSAVSQFLAAMGMDSGSKLIDDLKSGIATSDSVLEQKDIEAGRRLWALKNF